MASDSGRSDVDTPGRTRPRQPSWGFFPVLLVIAGGACGTLARSGVDRSMPAPAGWPLPTLTVNIVGAFALGLLLEALTRRGGDTGRRKALRLLVGTGFFGAFTTYSAMTLESLQLFLDDRAAAAGIYLAASLVGGVLASWLGIWLGNCRHRQSGTTAAPGQRADHDKREGTTAAPAQRADHAARGGRQ